MGYDEIIRQLTHTSPDGDNEKWILEEIQGHRWSKNKNRKGKLDVLIKWKDEEEPTWEPMEIIKEDDPVTLAEYARENDLLEKSVWKWAKRYLFLTKSARNQIRKLNALRRTKLVPKYKFGEKVPRSIKESDELDKQNHSNGWKNAITLEVSNLHDKYKCFKVLPKGSKPPEDHIFVKLLWTFDVKFDGRKRARLVAGGHMTPQN